MPDPSPPQKAAIETLCQRVLIVAGPGSGKTFTLVGRGQHLFEERVVSDSEEILYLTFQVKAAEEIRDRFGGDIWAHTFHAFCFRLLMEYGERITSISNVLVPPFTVMDEIDQTVLMQECLDDLRWKNMSAGKLVEWYNLGEPPLREPAMASGMTHSDLRTVLFEYEQRKADSNAVDFRGLVSTLLRILVVDQDYLLYIRRRFNAIFVDEAQDTDPLQMVMVRLLVRPDTFLTVVGDTDQTLYSWRMAEPALLLGERVPVIGLPEEVKELNEVSLGGWGNLHDEDPWDVHHLGENWRSDQRIVEGAKRLIVNNVDRHEIPLAATSELPGVVQGFEYDYEQEEDHFLRLVAHAKSFEGTLAILTRTNDVAGHFARLLREDGNFEHYLIGEESDMWESQHAKRLLYVLRAASNRFDRWTALRIISELRKDVDGALVAKMREMSATDGRALLDVAAKEIPELRRSIHSIQHVQKMPEEPGKISAAIAMAKTIIPWTPIHKRIEAYAEAWARGGQSLAAFLFFASYNKEHFREKKEINPGTIWISTVHKAKGKEWDGVIVLAERGEFPPRTKKDEEEERRVFYVAVTRPRHRLFLPYADSRTRFARLRRAGPSQYLKEMWPDGLDMLELGQ